MFTNIFYVLRSKKDGKYLITNQLNKTGNNQSFLFVFNSDSDAMLYLNHHAPEYAHNFVIESASNQQLKAILTRWGFTGIGIVKDTLIPEVEFLIEK